MKTINIYGNDRFAEHSKVREACRGIVVREGMILLTYEVNTDQWFIPGGGLEGEEMNLQCCARELAEETGFLVDPLFHFATINEYYEDWLFISHYFICQITGETQRLLTDQEREVGLEPRWIPLQEAVSIFSRYQEYAGDEMKRGVYLRECEALKAYTGPAMQEIHRGKKYYAAYEERYKTAHALGVSWSGDVCTPIVMEMLEKYHINRDSRVLEIGCGEGRDARVVLEHGYRLMATDLSREAIAYCQKQMPQFASSFSVLDCLSDRQDMEFDFVYGIAVLHMLVLDGDRDGFCRFVRDHLKPEGLGLICTMGDGETEFQSDIEEAFTLQERNHESGKILVAGTSCRVVSFRTFEKELERNGLIVVEKGITSALPNFNNLMYAVVKTANRQPNIV